MKKITLLILTLCLLIFVSACRDKKDYDNTVTVMFYTFANDSQVSSYFDVEPHTLIEEPDVIPVRAGYEFDGWYKDKEHTILWDFASDKVGEDSIALFAGWTAGFYQVFYDTNGGTYPADFMLLEDFPEDKRDPETNAELLKYLFFKVGDQKVIFRPTRTGYTFKAWFLYDEYEWEGAPADATVSYKPGDRGFTTLPTSKPGDISLYAHWDAIKISISFRHNYPVENVLRNPGARTRTYGLEIIYDGNYDGVSPNYNSFPDFTKDENFVGGSVIPLDYEFIGWNTRADGTGTWYREGDTLERTATMTVFAQWAPKS